MEGLCASVTDVNRIYPSDCLLTKNIFISAHIYRI